MMSIEKRKTICPFCGDNEVINHTLSDKTTCVRCGFQFTEKDTVTDEKQPWLSFRAESREGEIIEASCVINKPGHLFLSNEAKPGHWTRCKPETLEVVLFTSGKGEMVE